MREVDFDSPPSENAAWRDKHYIMVFSEGMARDWAVSGRYVMISITENDREAVLHPGYLDVLRVSFDEVSPPQARFAPELRPLFGRDALRIWEFADAWHKRGVDHIVVHCHAGVCRTAAVAAALCAAWGIDDSYINENCSPSEHVRDLIMHVARV